MARQFTEKVIPKSPFTNPAQPDPVLIAFTEPGFGQGIPIGPDPGATDAPKGPNIKAKMRG